MPNSYNNRSGFRSYDWKLIIYYLLLVIIGWVNIYASIHSGSEASILDWGTRSGKQFVWILSSLGLAGIILFVLPAHFWESTSTIFYLGVILLLAAVIFLGIEVKGSRSWFEFGPIRFQPAEISKISTALMLASIMSQPTFKFTRFKDFIHSSAVVILPILIILAEKETGSALVYLGFIFMFYREGLSGWLLVLIGLIILLFILTLTASAYTSLVVLLGVVMLCNINYGAKKIFRNILIVAAIIAAVSLLPKVITKINPFTVLLIGCAVAIPFVLRYAWKNKKSFLSFSVAAFLVGVGLIFSTEFIFNDVLQDHQRKRIEVLLGIKEDPSGVGYNVNQSMIAIGSGGLTGKGFLQGTQTTYGFVPEQSTDFIFCTVGEEWGFLGCSVVILLYSLLIFQLIRDAEKSRESFTRIYGYCVACCFFMHLFINVGMTIGIMPVIGIPLPLMSYGGSSLWSFTILLFIFIALDHKENRYF